MSETGDFESELNKLLAEDEARRLRAEETSFACRFLMERGIVTFDYSDPTAKPPLPELSLDDLDSEQDFINSYINEVQKNISVTTEVLIAAALSKRRRELNIADTDAKKKLQAKLMAEGQDQAFVELVDTILDGEPLSPNDFEIYQEAVFDATKRDLRQVVIDAEAEVKLQAALELLDTELEKAGLTDDDINQRTLMALSELAALYISHESIKEFMQGRPVTSEIDNARNILETWGIDDPRWHQVIQQLFG